MAAADCRREATFVKMLSRYLIALPVALLPALTLFGGGLHAQGVPAQQAVEILSRAKAADGKCQVLSAGERDELARYSARAEIAAASQVSVDKARRARSRGETAGKAAECSTNTAADVRETLTAAREAITATDAKPTAPKLSKPKQASKDVPKQAKPAAHPKAANQGGPGLSAYGEIIAAYYVERRCRHLSRGDANRFWRRVVTLHRATVARFGASAVAPLKRNAERQARRVSCGGTTMAQVKSGFGEVLSR